MQTLINALASGLYISYLPALVIPFKKNTGAGFLGTLLAVPFVWVWPENVWAYIVCLILFVTACVWVCARAKLGNNYTGHDNPKIVLDEVAGYCSAMLALPRTWPYMLAAFVLFRIFDTLKPWPVCFFDRMPNAFGVVFDDVAAGLLTTILIHVFLLCTQAGIF